MAPKQRKPGQFGQSGRGHRENIGAFRADGGVVGRKKKSCGLLAVVVLLSGMGAVATLIVGINHIL